MDFELDDDQRAILDGVEALLARHAGAPRAAQLAASGAYDHALDAALRDGGYVAIARTEGAGLLEAALVAEAVARAGGVVTFAAEALVGAMLAADDAPPLPGPLALATHAGLGAPIRWLPHARTLLVVATRDDPGGDGVRRLELGAGDVEPVRSTFGYPAGRLTEDARARLAVVPGGTADRVVALWRLALAVEAVGAMGAALATTIEHVTTRRQFGRAIGSFQGVQHRLAHSKVLLEGSRWLALEAAAKGAPAEGTAVAAAYALSAATHVARETHQFTGAMGFTCEHALHVWTMRLRGLALDLGGVRAHRAAIAEARWGAPARARGAS